ncbi:DUF2235 domain-containing protein [Providencia rettgeri]|uniref:DUF2235 domain-containing protein n=1 Tax=Providencia TaxID=586 RepID=UPI001CFDF30C|nr:DUF2235 domain-containing protein [Providencia rettgeri]EIU7556874.1 DUF2235 domain-containing protein [Providencia rettgeri]MCB4839224.1 DUF2235 domain-containing protein [Providencia rettgeri]HEM8305101.1 DUF2235 domain-containing protein [Providencia rettgeri]
MNNDKRASTDSIIAATNKAKQAQECKLGNCSRTLHIALFFDGVGKNKDLDEPKGKLSNIGKLFYSFPGPEKNTNKDTYNAYYISGLGTPYQILSNQETNEATAEIYKETKNNIQDSIRDTGLEAGFDYAIGKDGFKKIEELVSPKGQVKMFAEAGFDAAAKIGIEATPFLRDNEFIAYNFVTGVETRINDLKERFARACNEAQKGEIPLNLISVSVFGFDMGATLARYFIGVLVNQLCQKNYDTGLYFYGGVHGGAWVDIPFVGLFDCSRDTPESEDNGLDYGLNILTLPAKSNKVTEVAIDSLITMVSGRKYIDHMTPLPTIVKKSLHLIAAHEKRKWRCLYLTGRSGEHHQEELLPGCSEDIGGGLRANEQKPNEELAKVALTKMHLAAFHAGVPFPELDELREMDFDTWLYFQDEEKVEGKKATEWVDYYQSGIPLKKLTFTALNAHLDSYFAWLGQKHYEYKFELRRLEKQESDAWLSPGSHQGGYNISPTSKKEALSASQQIALLKKDWGWLSKVAKEAGQVVTQQFGKMPDSIKRSLYYPAIARAQNYIDCGTAGYDGKSCPTSRVPIFNELYGWFVHDIQRAEGINYRYFYIRLMEPLSGQFAPDEPEVYIPPQAPQGVGNDFIFTGFPKL